MIWRADELELSFLCYPVTPRFRNRFFSISSCVVQIFGKWRGERKIGDSSTAERSFPTFQLPLFGLVCRSLSIVLCRCAPTDAIGKSTTLVTPSVPNVVIWGTWIRMKRLERLVCAEGGGVSMRHLEDDETFGGEGTIVNVGYET